MEEKKSRRWPLLVLILALIGLLGGGKALFSRLSQQVRPETPSAVAQAAEVTPTPTEDLPQAAAPEPAAAEEPASEPGRRTVPAPDFTVYDREGNTVSLSDFAGKPRVINFWATWCPPCRSELPGFENLWREFGEEIPFLMVDLTDGARETGETLEAFLAETGYAFPVYLDSDQDAALKYGVHSIPMTVLVDAEGSIVAYQIGALSEEALRPALEALKEQEE